MPPAGQRTWPAQALGGANYTGEQNYVHEQAVSDGGIVTANGSAALEFARELLLLLENDMPEDFYSIDLMNAYASLGRIIGEEVGEDVVNEIFIYNKYQPFDEDYLKEFFSDDIRRFINKQYKYLSNLLKEVNKDEYKN